MSAILYVAFVAALVLVLAVSNPVLTIASLIGVVVLLGALWVVVRAIFPPWNSKRDVGSRDGLGEQDGPEGGTKP